MAFRSLILAAVLARFRKAFTDFYRLWKAVMSQCQKYTFCPYASKRHVLTAPKMTYL